MSSFGGFFGALLGLWIHFGRSRRPWLVEAEILLQGLVVGWVFGRLGCTLVHDHVGRPGDFPLAIAFPAGARHDLGLYEFLYTLLVLVPALLWINRRPRAPGTTLWVVAWLYAPARFALDFLRHTDLPNPDPRFLGLTVAQYGCVVLVWVGLHFWRSTRPGPASLHPRRR
jgi:phosphatidylglycerol:prolipoprotein diacylglycerol transferase